MHLRSAVVVPVAGIILNLTGKQVRAKGFSKNLQSLNSIFRKKLVCLRHSIKRYQNNNDRPDERRIILNNNNTMENNLINNDLKNVGNEKQNSLTSGIRIGEFGIVFAHNKEELNHHSLKLLQ